MQKVIKLIENLPKPLRNKYILTIVLFLLWLDLEKISKVFLADNFETKTSLVLQGKIQG